MRRSAALRSLPWPTRQASPCPVALLALPTKVRPRRSFTALSSAAPARQLFPSPLPSSLAASTSLQLRRWQSSTPTKTDHDRPNASPSTSSSTATGVSADGEASKVSRPSKAGASKISLSEVRRLMSLAQPEKRTLYIATGLLLVSSAVSLSVPFTLGRVIDLFTDPEKAALPFSVGTAAALLTGVFLLGAVANTGRSILMVRRAVLFESR